MLQKMAYFLLNLTDINLNNAEYKNELTVPLCKNEEDPLLKFLDDNFEKSYSVSVSTETMDRCNLFGVQLSRDMFSTGNNTDDTYQQEHSCSVNNNYVFYNNVWTILFPWNFLEFSALTNPLKTLKTQDKDVNLLISLYKTDLLLPVSTYIIFQQVPVSSGTYTERSGNNTADIYDPSVDSVHSYTVNDVNFKTIFKNFSQIDGCEPVWIFADNKEDVSRFIKELKILIKCAYRQLIHEKYSNIYEKCSYLFSYEERTKYCSKCCTPYCRDRLLEKEDVSDAVLNYVGFAYMPYIKHLVQIL